MYEPASDISTLMTVKLLMIPSWPSSTEIMLYFDEEEIVTLSSSQTTFNPLTFEAKLQDRVALPVKLDNV